VTVGGGCCGSELNTGSFSGEAVLLAASTLAARSSHLISPNWEVPRGSAVQFR